MKDPENDGETQSEETTTPTPDSDSTEQGESGTE